MDAQEVLARLAADREHGASEIADRALDALAALAAEADEPLEALAEAGAGLVEAHPAMAPLLHLANDVCVGYQADGDAVFERLDRERGRRARALAQAGAERIGVDDVVATYSRSGTVLDALRRAIDDGPRFRVVTSEARPGGEGRSVAAELARAGIDVTLTYDAALPGLVREADRLIVGADSICTRGLVNKAGTGVLVREADRAGVPADVLAGTDKLLPPSYRKRPPLTAAGRLGHRLPAGVHEAAPLFECEPLDPIDRVVTEQGAWTPEETLDALGAIELHPRLAERL